MYCVESLIFTTIYLAHHLLLEIQYLPVVGLVGVLVGGDGVSSFLERTEYYML